jgi:hypothetical protein
MPELDRKKSPIVNAILDPFHPCLQIVDWQGKSLLFFLAKELFREEKPSFLEDEKEKET